MKLLHFILYYLFAFLIFSCNHNERIPVAGITPAPQEDTIRLRIDSLKNICRPGDLLVRLGDDFISDRIRYLSTKDPAYSHAGIIVNHDGEKMVCHIYPDDFVPGADTIRYDIIDSFLNTRTNLKCALYRYDLSDTEKLNAEAEFSKYHNARVHFDKLYALETDDKLYCTEMIYKVLKKVTSNRVDIQQSHIPQNMQHLVSVYFKKYNFNKNIISSREIIAIDNLYTDSHCRLLMKFALKDIP